MSLRASRTPLIAVIVLVSLAAVVGLWSRRPHRPPSVVVYLIDTLRPDHLSSYGYGRRTSPQLERLAAEGVLFRRAYAPSSWTKPSVASLLTGLFPSRHGAVGKEHRIRPDVPSFPELLQRHGYTTAAFISNPNVLPPFGFGRGFDEVVDIGARAWAEGRPAGRAREVNEAVFAYLAEHEQRPLFLYVHVIDPHKPYGAPPGPFRKAFKPEAGGLDERERLVALYDGEIAYVDDLLADFFSRLEQEGLYDEAILAVVSDHGEEFWEHGGGGHGHTLFEELLSVPLILRLPGAAHAGLEVEGPVRLLDLMPTVAELVGIDSPPEADGRSFASLLTGVGVSSSYEPLLYAELTAYGHALTSLTADGYKLIRRSQPSDQRGEALYRIEGGSGEQRDVSAEEPERLEVLRQRLDSLEGALFGGVYVELRNGLDPDAVHRFEGRLESGAGALPRHEALDHADGFRPSDDGTALSFDVTLRNQELSIRQNPPVIMDVARFRIAAQRPLRLTVLVDGQPLPTQQLLLGAERVAGGHWPLELVPGAPDIRLRSPALLGQPGAVDTAAPHAVVYEVPRGESSAITLDPEVDERLRALGYVDSP